MWTRKKEINVKVMLEKKRIEIERRMNPKGEKEILGIEGDVVSCLEIPLESVLGKDISFISCFLHPQTSRIISFSWLIHFIKCPSLLFQLIFSFILQFFTQQFHKRFLPVKSSMKRSYKPFMLSLSPVFLFHFISFSCKLLCQMLVRKW